MNKKSALILSACALAASTASADPAQTAPKKPSTATVEVSGKVTQGALLIATVKGGKVVGSRFPGHRVAADAEGSFPVAFGRNAPKHEELKVLLEDKSEVVRGFDVEQRTFEKDAIDGLPDDEVKVEGPKKKVQDALDARIEAARMKSTEGRCWAQGFAWPAKGKITSRYGQPRVLNGVDGGIHWGIDIAVPLGTKVVAPACGTVVFAELDVPLSGGTMVIDHGHGVTSSFLHLSSFAKKVGDVVKQGEVVAQSGATGRATGPHLDWRMNYFEVRVDPELLVPAMAAK